MSGADPDGDALTFALAGEPAHGTLVFGTDGGLHLHAGQGLLRRGQLQRHRIGRGGDLGASVALTVEPVNDASRFTTTASATHVVAIQAAALQPDPTEILTAERPPSALASAWATAVAPVERSFEIDGVTRPSVPQFAIELESGLQVAAR